MAIVAWKKITWDELQMVRNEIKENAMKMIKTNLDMKRWFTEKIGGNRMEERIESIKNRIDDYLQNANNESDCKRRMDWFGSKMGTIFKRNIRYWI